MSERPCRWPGCTAQVPANMWGCRGHWYRLPKSIRDRIWAAYRPGQEDDLRLSAEYVEAEGLAQAFAAGYEAEKARAQRMFDQRRMFDV